jgi:protein-S-isoprenylcysteine O-methyltransferase Ste14
MIFIGLSIFLPAGTILWWEGWVYFIMLLSYFIIMLTYLSKKDPELLKKRTEMNIKERWDKIITFLLGLSFIALYIFPGFDAVRFQWTNIPIFIEIIGFIGFGFSLVFLFWVFRENTYLSRVVEVQEERGHKVITTGPYKIVRHPMYLGFFFFTISHCFALGSLISLIPAVMFNITLSIRTRYEDKLLHERLDGYQEYAEETKYKLIPGVW